MKKLVIWDFDGVIADTEKLWIQVWRNTLKSEKNIVLSPEQELQLIIGVADRDKKTNLEAYFPELKLDENFMHKIDKGYIYQGMHFLQPIAGVENVMADTKFSCCIATGATKQQHTWKMKQLPWIKKYMSVNDFFTVDMVKNGKPAPDIFLLAANTKGFMPNDCIVIGDSLNDFMAANSAGMKSIAFVGAEGNNTELYIEKCRKAGVYNVCKTMDEVHNTLNQWYNSF